MRRYSFAVVVVCLLLSASMAWAQISNLTVSNITDTTVMLNWTGTADHFTVSRQPAGGTFCCGLTVPGTATTATHTGLAPSTSYTFLVQARNSSGAQIGSASVQATTLASAPPPPPPSPTCGTGNAIQTVSWMDNSSGAGQEQGFNVEKSCNNGTSWEPAGQVGTDVTSLTVSTLPNGVNLCYRVMAFNSAGQSPFSAMACKLTPLVIIVPATPGTVVILNQVP